MHESFPLVTNEISFQWNSTKKNILFLIIKKPFSFQFIFHSVLDQYWTLFFLELFQILYFFSEMKYLWLIIFLFGNSYQINSDILYNNDKDSRQNDWPINDTNGTENLAAGSRNYSREERSNFLTVLKNPNVQSHLQKTNPNLLHYFSHKDNHVFTDIMRKISSATANNTNNQVCLIELNSSFIKLLFLNIFLGRTNSNQC